MNIQNITLFVILLTGNILLTSSVLAQPTSEELNFELRFGWIKGGEVHYRTTPSIHQQQNTIKANLNGYTTGFTNVLYGVNDAYESQLDPTTLLPFQSSKKLKEKNFNYVENIQYQQKAGLVISDRSGKHQVAEGICDISALFFKLRFSGELHNLEINQILKIPFWDTNEWYYLEIKYAGEENIRTKLGNFRCQRFEPLHVSGRFFDKQNPLNIWITSDSRKLPVLTELNFTIGSVKCELLDFKQDETDG
ncbi:MAG: DUF3108 domain-containing protein [Prolixibacteraceae bacterium]